MVDFGLYFMYGLIAIAAISAVVFPVLQAVKDPKGLMRSAVGVLVLVVVFVICYALSEGDTNTKYTALGVGAGGSKLVGAGLLCFYIALVAAIVGIVYSEVVKAFK